MDHSECEETNRTNLARSVKSTPKPVGTRIEKFRSIMESRQAARVEGLYVDVLEGDLATLRAENERLRAALTEMVRVHGGSHSEDCHACGAHDDDVSDDPDTPDPHCDCGALATRQAARAALRGGQ